MKLAIMQPYFFPYLGYFQLINAVDKFVIYDDVSFIKGGWINRNYFLLNKRKTLITLPLIGCSSNKIIKDITVDHSKYNLWRKKFFQSIELSYKRAPYFDNIFILIKSLFLDNVHGLTISEFNFISLRKICQLLNIDTEIVQTSSIYKNKHLNGQNRILDICMKENASEYINAIGGKELYDQSSFKSNAIKLSFINTNPYQYQQFNNKFIPNLSIIDLLMFNSIGNIRILLEKYSMKVN